ncbi:MAG TPA: 50S ribosomal protein L11 methyltransferase [Vicinamibacterales bacterium]|nr:50S ribosomal protein L11 methyltransferase [Vicinamibacterales bacterium]
MDDDRPAGMSYGSIAGQRSMALDHSRNRAYARALEAVVTPESVVLDPGAGTGILGLMAARLGARRVYLVEPEDVMAVTREIVQANGLASRVVCLQGRMQQVALPEPVDIIVSALTGNFLLTEDLGDLLLLARDRALKPGGQMLPSEAVMEVVPVSAPALHDREIAAWSIPEQAVDLSPARAYAANTIFYRSKEIGEAEWLADPVDLQAYDFGRDSQLAVHTAVSCEVRQSGLCHGWVGWFRMRLADRWLSTSPREAPLHWAPAFLPVDPPIRLREGETVTLGLDREPRGDWAWRMTAEQGGRSHSTLLSMPLSETALAYAAPDFRPPPSGMAQAVVAILTACDGTRTIETIAREIHARFPAQVPTADEALRLVQAVSRRYA